MVPKIPEGRQRGISTNVPGVQDRGAIRSAGAVADAAGQIGRALAGFGADLHQKHERARDNENIFGALNDYQNDLSRSHRDGQLNAVGDAAGYKESHQEFAQKTLQGYINGAQSDRAREEIMRRGQAMLDDSVLRAETFQMKKAAMHFKDSANARIKDRADRHLTNPDFTQALHDIDDSEEELEAGVGIHTINEEQAANLKIGARNSIAEGVLGGLLRTEQYEVGIGLLEGKNEGAPLIQEMDEDRRVTWLDQFKRKFEADKQNNTKISTNKFKNMISSMYAGDGPTLRTQAQIVAGVITNPGVQEADKISAQQQYNIAKIVEPIMKNVGTMTISEFEEKVRGLDTGNFEDHIFREQAEAHVRAAFASHLKQRNDDPFNYVLQNNPGMAMDHVGTGDDFGADGASLQTIIDRNLLEQERLGVPSDRRKVMPNDSAYSLALAFDGPHMGPQAKAKLLDDIIGKYGDHADVAIDQMVDTKVDGFGPYMKLASNVTSNATKARIITLHSNRSTIEENYKSRIKQGEMTGATTRDISRAIGEATDDLRMAFNLDQPGGLGDKHVLAMTKTMELDLKQMASVDPDFDADDAIAQSYSEIVGSNFTFVRSGNGVVMVPNKLSGGKTVQVKFVKSFMLWAEAGDNMKKLKKPDSGQMMIPRVSPDVVEDLIRKFGPDITKEEIEERWFESLKEGAVWTRNKSDTGIVLRIKQNKNRTKMQTVLDQDLKPIEVLYSEINNMSDKEMLGIAKGRLPFEDPFDVPGADLGMF